MTFTECQTEANMEIFEEILKKGKIYLKDMENAYCLEKRYRELQLTSEQFMAIDDYIACLMTAMSRKVKIAYTLGTLDNKDNYM